ncbi:MAG: alanine racemase [Oscillospiraceae bacterium]|jgi:alanine racemase|nr:alanine racemase [Oscillospiraceae bacterium]
MPTDFLKRTWAEIDLDAMAGNMGRIRSRLRPETKIMAVVKADAYGHGDIQAARTFAALGISWFGVATIEEAISLRRGGIGGNILILGSTPPEQAALLVEYGVQQTVYSINYAEALRRFCGGAKIEAHLAIDTGMGRIGLNACEAKNCLEQAKRILSMPEFDFTGIFTHFAVSDDNSPENINYTREQFERFMAVCSGLDREGRRPPLRHCCNSAAILSYPEMQLEMVRPGIILYGLNPSDRFGLLEGFRPAMRLKSIITLVKEIKAGQSVSYGRTFTAESPRTIATVSAGYADGYPRLLSNKGRALVNGAFAPVAGRVCMDQLMIDITGLSTKEGDEVTLFGDGEKKLRLEELAGAIGTVNYELCCLVGSRVPRVYFSGGKKTETVRYKNMIY